MILVGRSWCSLVRVYVFSALRVFGQLSLLMITDLYPSNPKNSLFSLLLSAANQTLLS
jgi:hypothetical protein